MAGNAVVLKPSELTPLTGLKIKDVIDLAGLADGLLQVVTGDGSTGAALVVSGVDKIMFTGSGATGKRVAEAAAKYLTPVVLELGGKDPMVVLDDANVKNAARGAIWGAFANSGQACASVERCYVHESIADQFIKEVVAETKSLRQAKLGSEQGAGRGPRAGSPRGVEDATGPAEESIDIGSMTSEQQLRTVERHVHEATARGAIALTGGERAAGASSPYFKPTVLTNVNHGMDVMREETFGPVLPIMTFKTDDDAVRLANDSVYGLTASVWTSNLSRGKRIAERVDAGTVMINEALYSHGIAQTPWGGVKQSGFGRTHGRAGLLEMVQPKYIDVDGLPGREKPWWYRYGRELERAADAFLRFEFSGSIGAKMRNAQSALKAFFRDHGL